MFHNTVILGTASIVVLLSLQCAVLPTAEGFFFNRNNTQSNATNNSVTFGKLAFGDRLLFMDVIKENMDFWGITGFPTVADVQFPLKGETNNATISYIVADDKSTRGRGAYAKIYKGGIGQKNVTLRLQSQPWGGIYFVVQIYGQ